MSPCWHIPLWTVLRTAWDRTNRGSCVIRTDSMNLKQTIHTMSSTLTWPCPRNYGADLRTRTTEGCPLSSKQLKIDYDAAQKVKTGFDNAKKDLEENAESMPSSGKYGDGEVYIAFALSSFAEASGAFGLAAGYGSTAIRDGVNAFGEVDSDTANNIRKLAEEMPDD